MSTIQNVNPLSILALDPGGAKIREDGFSCIKTDNGFELVIVVVIPPIQDLVEKNIQQCLSSSFIKASRSNSSIQLFQRNNRMEYSLKEGKLRPVLAVKYFINKDGKIKQRTATKNNAIAIWIDHLAHNEEEMCNNAHKVVKMIHKNHKGGRRLEKISTRWDKYGISSDQRLSNLLLDLFSFTCREICTIKRVPYYNRGPCYGDVIVSHPYFGNFNKPMRDVLSLINLLNLHNKILGNDNFLFGEKEMFITLNKMHGLIGI